MLEDQKPHALLSQLSRFALPSSISIIFFKTYLFDLILI